MNTSRATRTAVSDDWWGELNGDVLACLDVRGMSAAELGHKLGFSEEGVVSLVTMLAREGKVRLTMIERAG